MENGAYRPSTGYQLVTIGLSSVMVAAALGSVSRFWHMDLSGGATLLTSLLAALAGWLLWRAPLLAGGGALLTAVALAFWQRENAALRDWLGTLRHDWFTFYEQMRQYNWETTFGPTLGALFIWAVALGLATLIVREALRRGTAFWSVIAGVFLFGIQWAWYFDDATSYFSFYLMGGFLLWAAAASAHRDARWLASGRKIGYGSHFHSVAIWILVAALAGASLPINWKPVNLGQVADRLQETFPALKELRGTSGPVTGGRFNLKMSGFSVSTLELGGRITLDQAVAFNLVTPEPLPGTAYLRGGTATVYTGRGWAAAEVETLPYPETGVLPSLYAASVPRTHVSYQIEPLIPLGASIFHVLEPTQVHGLSGLHRDADGNIWADRAPTRTRPYTVDSRWILYNLDQIRERTLGTPGSGWEPYLQLPEGMTDRVRELTSRLTEAARTPIDKALAIENYLRQMPYTLDVPPTPSGKDFVDYFLFELKEGYCVYYASAMVLMLRQVGIPARWVQGFALPADGEQIERDGMIVYPVRNSLAHAWVEAYFPGFGWVTFEPTPRADLPIIGREAPVPEDLASSRLFTSDEPTMSPDDFLPTGAQGRGTSEETPVGALPEASATWPRWVLGALAALGLLGWAVYARLRRQERLRSTLPVEMIQESWEKVSWLLGRFGFGRQDHQTPLEYAQEIGTALPPLQQSARAAAADYARARYGATGATQEQAIKRTQELWEQADELLYDRVGWATYLWRRLISRMH